MSLQMFKNEIFQVNIPFFIQKCCDILSSHSHHVLLMKLCIWCAEKSLCMLNISSWSGGIEVVMKEHIRPYSESITHLLNIADVCQKSSASGLPRHTFDQFIESFEKLFDSWHSSIIGGKLMLNEVLLLSEEMIMIERLCALLHNEQLLSNIKHNNKRMLMSFNDTLLELRDELLPLITITKGAVDIYRRLVNIMASCFCSPMISAWGTKEKKTHSLIN